MLKFTVSLFVIYLLKGGVIGEENTTVSGPDEDENEIGFKYDEREPYCFRFTWLGPEYTNQSTVSGNETCKELREKRKVKNIPCQQPLVITFDGTPPNLTYLHQNHRDNVLCHQAKGFSCVKYSYFFDEKLQNVTYMCAKVLAINEGSITSGCYSQSDSGYETEVCVCDSNPKHWPCNIGFRHFLHFPSIVFCLIISSYYNTY